MTDSEPDLETEILKVRRIAHAMDYLADGFRQWTDTGIPDAIDQLAEDLLGTHERLEAAFKRERAKGVRLVPRGCGRS